MKRWKWAFALFLVYVFPYILASILTVFFGTDMSQRSVPGEDIPISRQENTVAVLSSDTVIEMDLETYVLGVLLGEMPADFSEEAWKAQAVAIRTYALKNISTGGKHENADLCTESVCCQAYIDPDNYLLKKDGGQVLAAMVEAVKQTQDQVLMYEDTLIDATYFSCSGGMTEAAVAVWGTDIPYLQSVVSPGEERSKHYRDTFTFTKEDFLLKLGIEPDQLEEPVISEITYSEGGGIVDICVCGQIFSGTKLRSLLELPSTACSLEEIGDAILLTTKGYGHRVGMSQYGAEAMAVAGSSYQQILQYYYPGTTLVTMNKSMMQGIFDKEKNL